MILITGGTGFVGQALTNRIVIMGRSVRILLRPSRSTPALPRSTPVEVAVCSLNDERGLRAAMKGVDTIFHLIGSEHAGSRSDLTGVDIENTISLVKIASQASVSHFCYLSHIGADQTSAYPLLKAKAIAERAIIKSGINYTIVRSALAYGPGDHFTTSLAHLLRISPVFFLLPGDGTSLLQPIWIEDLAACLGLVAEDAQMLNQTISIGGSEPLTFLQIVKMIMSTLKTRRLIIRVYPAYLRIISLWLEQIYPRLPVSTFWLDYLAADRTAPLDTLPRIFGLIPARMKDHLGYLKGDYR